MKKLFLLSGVALAASTFCLAAPIAPCTSGTLASYFALSMGCSVNDQQFSGFAPLTVPFGSTPILSSAITVSPITTASMPGLLFTLNASASGAQLFETVFGFNVMPVMGGSLIAGSTLTQNGGVAGGPNGAVTGVETLCLGAALAANGSCPGTPSGKNPGTFALPILTQAMDATTFPSPRSLVGATGDFSLTGGGNGSASVNSFAIQFSTVAAPSAVPEPATIFLSSFALLGLGLARRLSNRRPA